MLLSRFRLSAVTLNYDLLLERVLEIIGSYPGHPPSINLCDTTENLPFSERALPANTITLHKVHGGLQFDLRTGLTIFTRGYEPNPWTRPIDIGNNYIGGVTVNVDRSRKKMPFIPDMVPPGHSGDDICNPYAKPAERSQAQIAQADIVIFCGLSAEAPDTEEVEGLVRRIKPSAVVQIGLEGDNTNELSKVLARHRSDHYFVDAAKEFTRIPALIMSAFPPKCWRGAAQPIPESSSEAGAKAMIAAPR